MYYFAPAVSGVVTVTLCASQSLAASFDTKLYVLQNLAAPAVADPATAVACNDDSCGYLSQLEVGSDLNSHSQLEVGIGADSHHMACCCCLSLEMGIPGLEQLRLPLLACT